MTTGQQGGGGEALTSGQRTAVMGAHPDTGEVTAARTVLGALVKRGLAVAYGATGRHYLTAAGRQLRATLAAPGPLPEPPATVFAVATGDEVLDAEPTAARRREVAVAWAGTLEMRRLEDAAGRPAAWERAQPMRAVCLALEAGGVLPSARDRAGHRTRTGYRVLDGESGGVRVEWRGPASSSARRDAERELAGCAAVLADGGWSAVMYLGNGQVRYLQVTSS